MISPFQAKLRAFLRSWNPEDCSRNIYIKSNGFTLHRNPVAQENDAFCSLAVLKYLSSNRSKPPSIGEKPTKHHVMYRAPMGHAARRVSPAVVMRGRLFGRGLWAPSPSSGSRQRRHRTSATATSPSSAPTTRAGDGISLTTTYCTTGTRKGTTRS